MAGTRRPISPGTEFAREFLKANWRRVAYMVLSQAAVIFHATQSRWGWCALWLMVMASNVWELVRRAAGIPAPVRKPREEMSPREAFWLDPSAVFDRQRRGSRAA